MKNIICALLLLLCGDAFAANSCDEQAENELGVFSKADLSRYPSLKITWAEAGSYSSEGEDVEIKLIQFGNEHLLLIKAVFFGHKMAKSSYQYAIRGKYLGYSYNSSSQEFYCKQSMPRSSLRILEYVKKRLKEKGVDLTNVWVENPAEN